MSVTHQSSQVTLESKQNMFTVAIWCFGFATMLMGLMLRLNPFVAVSALALPLVASMWQLWPKVTIFFVILSSFINIVEWYPKVVGLNLKPELIIGILGLGLVLLKMLLEKSKPKITPVGSGLLLWVFATMLSSVNSADPIRSATLSFLILLAIIPFFVTINTIQSVRIFDFAFNSLLWIGICEGVFGIAAWFIGQTINFAPFANMGASGYFVTNGTWMETNIFGDFLVATTMLFVAKLPEWKSHWWLLPLVGICSIGILMSQTRGAWLSLAACLLLLPVILTITKMIGSPRKLFWFLAIVLVLSIILLALLNVVTVASPNNDFLQRRIASFNYIEVDATFSQRLNVNSVALNSFLDGDNIFLGRGAKGFQLAGFDILGVDDDWIGNIFLGALYDGGLIGLLGFSLAIGIALLRGLRQARQTSDPNLKGKLTALFMACLAIVFTGQSNNHSWLVLVWIHFGILTAGINLTNNVAKTAR